MEMHAHPAINICRRPVKPSQVEIFLYLDALCIREVNRHLKFVGSASGLSGSGGGGGSSG